MTEVPTKFALLHAVLLNLASEAAQGAAYAKNWGDEFRSKMVDEVWLNTQSIFRPVRKIDLTCEDVFRMTDDERRILGFMSWSDSSDLILIPLWLYNYIADGQIVVDIFGHTAEKGTDKIDLDVRGGCIAYGFSRSANLIEDRVIIMLPDVT